MLDALVLPDELPVVTSQLSGVADNLDSSLTRYYKNNFTDRDRQLGFDLLHGKEVSFEEGEFTSRKSKRHQPYIAYATAPNNNNNNNNDNTVDDSKKQSSRRRPSHAVGFFDRYMLPHEQCVRDMRYGLQLRKMVPGVLFTMTRSKNKNVVVYATKDATQVSITEPVDDLVSAYWLKVDTGDEPSTDLSTPPQDVLARRRSLSYLESMTSYGLCDVWSPLDSEDRSALVPSCTGDSAASALTPASLLGSIRFTLHMLPPHYVVKLRILSNGHTVAILCNGHNQDFPQDCQIVQMYVNETERFFATPKINSVSFLLRQLQSSDFKEQVPSLGDIVEPSEAPKSHMFFVWRYEAEIAHDRSDESFKLLYSFTKATTPFAFVGQPSNKSRKNSLVMNNSIKKRKSKTSTIATEESAVDISNNTTTDGNTVEPTDADLSQDDDGEASDSGSEEDDGAYLSMSRIPRTHISAHVV
jgi:hypothetical protein